MNHFYEKIIPCLLVIFLFTACENTQQQEPTNGRIAPKTTEQPSSATPQKKDCPIQGKILENNQKFVKDQQTLIRIVADSTTYDNNLGESHRILEIYDTRDCKLINREMLPVNVSPDFPYMIADIIFNKNSHLVAIKGFGGVYCYDTKGQRLLPYLIPEYVNERFAHDAQSGMIKHLEVWENYLIGYAEDLGGFVFDMSNLDEPKALKPVAEYDLTGGDGEAYASLFFMRSENEKTYQAVLPFYDMEDFTFHVNPLFENPKFVSPFVSKGASNNRFIVIRTQEKPSQTFVVDMEKQSRAEVPKEIAAKKTQDILDWLKENKK